MTDASPHELAPRARVALSPEGVEPSDPACEELFQRTCAVLAQPLAPSRQRRKAILLLLTMLLFAGAAVWQIDLNLLVLTHWVLPVIGVLFLHELGHFAGMRLFGYHDVRMYFIPLIGAAVSGQKHAAPAWQQAIVLLLGPLPGIVLGLMLAVFHPPWLTSPVAFLLLIINGFNLLPFLPLDGGRLLHVLLLSRRPFLEAGFLVVSGIGFALLGWLNGSWLLGVLAVACLVSVPIQYQGRRQRVAARRELPELPADFSGLSEAHRRALFHAARSLKPVNRDPSEYAKLMQTLHAESSTKRTRALPSLALLSLYVAGVVVVVWSLNQFFFWGEGHPGEWDQRRIEAILKAELRLHQITLTEVAPGMYSGTGQTADETEWTLKVQQDREKNQLTWSAVSDKGEKKGGNHFMMNNGVILDETPR